MNEYERDEFFWMLVATIGISAFIAGIIMSGLVPW